MTVHSVYVPSLEQRNILALPAEIRIHILEYVFADNLTHDGYEKSCELGGILLDENYAASDLLKPLLVCRQFHQDASLPAFSLTHFQITNLFSCTSTRLSTLHPKLLSFLRHLSFRADDRQFRKLSTWNQCPFSQPSLNLTTLTIVLQRSSHWHYLFDFTASIVHLLRNLQNVKTLNIVRNGALVKGSFKTWYNRLVGLMLKVDHEERFLRDVKSCEGTWWKWRFEEVEQRIVLEAVAGKGVMEEEEYMLWCLPLMEELRVSVEGEEFNPDPRARLPYY